MEEFKYLGTTLTYQNSIQKEIKIKLRSGNACYHSMQNLLSSSLLSKNEKIKTYRTILLPVLYGCETQSLTFRKELRLTVFENRVLRRWSMRVRGVEKTAVKSFMICIPKWNVDEITGARSMYGENRNAHQVLVGKREGKTPGWTPSRKSDQWIFKQQERMTCIGLI